MQFNQNFKSSIYCSLLLFPLANIVMMFVQEGQSLDGMSCNSMVLEQAIILVVAAVAEELFFRGLLFYGLLAKFNWRPIAAGLATSVVFALMHLLNIFSYADLSYVVIQGTCAFAVGFNLAAIYYKYDSIVLCIVIHALINITSLGLDNTSDTGRMTLTVLEVSVFLAVSLLYFINGLKLLKEK